MDARSKRLKELSTPTPFSQGPEMKNYTRMMELQAQAPNFTANDPRFDELKAARRQYNREDKYKIGEKFNVAPLDVQNQFMDQTNVFRNAAPNVYGKMYPFSDLAMRYGESGGLLGMMAKEMFGKVKDIGSNIRDKIGITGAVDSDEEEMADYAAQTFGFGAPTFPGSEITIPYPHQDYPDDVVTEVNLPMGNSIDTMLQYPVVDYEAPIGEVSSMRSFGDRGTVPYGYEMNALDAIAEDDYRQGNKVVAYPPPIKEPPVMEGMAPPEIIEPLPFDDSAREAGIASMYGQGPRFATNNRRYENEYRNFIANMSDTLRQFGPVTYEEFADMYEKRYQGKPQMDFSRTMTLR